jgi:large subunit ribosomal protein L9
MSKSLKLLLTENVEALGIVGDVVTVRVGYARNFLLPRDLATKPSDEKIKALASKRAVAEKQLAELRRQRQELTGKLQGIEVTLIRSCNDQGVLYGSISQQDIATALGAMGHAVKPRDIRIAQVMKRVDKYEVQVKLDSDLIAAIKLTVQADRKLELERHEPEHKKDAEKHAEAPEGAAPAAEAAADAPKADAKTTEKKPKVKKDRPEGADKAKGEKKEGAEPTADGKKSVWGKPVDDSAKNLIPQARPRRERR